MNSRYLGARGRIGLEKAGDALLPGAADLLSFSQSGCVDQVDRVLDCMPEGDRKDLGLLLTVFSFVPFFVLKAFFGFLERAWESDWPIGGVLRLIRLGIRGLVLSLYYAEPTVLAKIGYQVQVAGVTDTPSEKAVAQAAVRFGARDKSSA